MYFTLLVENRDTVLNIELLFKISTLLLKVWIEFLWLFCRAESAFLTIKLDSLKMGVLPKFAFDKTTKIIQI